MLHAANDHDARIFAERKFKSVSGISLYVSKDIVTEGSIINKLLLNGC